MNTKEKAVQAGIILGNEVFKQVLTDLEASLVQQWKNSDTTEERESCWLKIDALRSVTEDLKALIHNDKIENN
jgi:hypothetical protein